MDAAMPEDALPNGGAPPTLDLGVARGRVSEMQAKLHRWAVADPGRRFDDLANLVYDPATLLVAFDRVAGNTGARTPGVDGLTVADVEQLVGVPGVPARPARQVEDRCVRATAGAGTVDSQAG
jgi:RNA-directed DNA polymerase